MKCKCGFENKDNAKFCTKCGNSLAGNNDSVEVQKPNNKNNSKIIIIALIAVIIILIGIVGYFAINMTNNVSHDNNQTNNAIDSVDQDNGKTEEVASEKKSWESIGSYSGSGSGSKTINVPPGKIKVKLSCFPIKNYATNHLYVEGSNGESGGVDWGPKSPVESRSDSFTYESSSEETFEIDYYETVSWEVEFFKYQ
ncbi:MAG: zinc ribbon domain-containing protein [Methanobrevibacter thaueri]|nr:zinc ribbon domain-containing protein [Methanobrevibacter thaueri]